MNREPKVHDSREGKGVFLYEQERKSLHASEEREANGGGGGGDDERLFLFLLLPPFLH